jgi:hypothetical protein
MEFKRKILIHGLVLAVIVILSPMTSASSPPCSVYAYTSAQNEPHYSLIKDNSYVFGNELTVISNCNNTELYLNGELFGSTDGKILNSYIMQGEHNLTVISGGSIFNFTNINFIQGGQLTNIINQLPNEYNPYSIKINPSEIDSIELMSGIGAIILSWFLITSILWRIINQYHQKNYCEEVSS